MTTVKDVSFDTLLKGITETAVVIQAQQLVGAALAPRFFDAWLQKCARYASNHTLAEFNDVMRSEDCNFAITRATAHRICTVLGIDLQQLHELLNKELAASWRTFPYPVRVQLSEQKAKWSFTPVLYIQG